jgi:hypothetical protein
MQIWAVECRPQDPLSREGAIDLLKPVSLSLAIQEEIPTIMVCGCRL